ncbi:hypothetical protein A2Z22_00195 [Candidatus Woesebacteria bacterium RBG_16_34_12]|uniref:Type II secretion system protein n=1 Tax=Candidatus Woesebacteria bacterium RBG_16_34_12 TaxID=1802480 RepID=A0A1F7X8V1_9BACT|nr:MAG: hypothetical protein A2Z22_00195 [Candidatus Woesebacteria bacterium RBG_16_34_12]
MKKEHIIGFSLVEMLVVVSIFAILAVLASQSLIFTFRGRQKSGSIVSVRENLGHALSVIERQLYNAENVNCIANGVTYKDKTVATYYDPGFSCIYPGSQSWHLATDTSAERGRNCNLVCQNRGMECYADTAWDDDDSCSELRRQTGNPLCGCAENDVSYAPYFQSPDICKYRGGTDQNCGNSPPSSRQRLCQCTNTQGFIASTPNNIRLTSNDINISSCTFTCIPGTTDEVPDTVEISVTANAVGSLGAEGEQVTLKSRIQLRSY